MLTDLTSSVTTISSEDLDKLFEGVPADAVNADGVQGGVRVDTEEEKVPVLKSSSDGDIPTIDLDEIDFAEEGEEGEEGDDKDKDKDKDVAEVTPTEEESDEEESEEGEAEVPEIKSVLKNTVDYLIKNKVFKEVEGFEELDLDEEGYAELIEKQIDTIVGERYEEKKQSAGEYGQAILDYLENGGDADELLDIFKERKEVEQVDLLDGDSQKDLITKWYKEQHGWSDTKIKKFVDTLISESDEALEEEAKEIKEKYDSYYTKQVEELKARQEEYNQQQEKIKKEFENNISKAIDTQELDDKRKKFLKDSIFKFKRTDDGRKVNDFYLKFAEWQADPSKYIELAEFILDKEGYLKRQEVKVKNEVVDKTFNFVKGNSALSKNKGSNHPQREAAKSKQKGTDFSFALKR